MRVKCLAQEHNTMARQASSSYGRLDKLAFIVIPIQTLFTNSRKPPVPIISVCQERPLTGSSTVSAITLARIKTLFTLQKNRPGNLG